MASTWLAAPRNSIHYSPDSAYAFRRLAASLVFAASAGAGMWAVIVVLPKVQAEFGVDRAAASAPYTMTMFGLAFGTVALGRLADRVGVAAPVLIAGLLLGVGFVLGALAPNLAVFSLAHLLLIGVGAGAGFAPMMADVSHWFVKRRGIAVVVVASGNYIAGAFWPLAMNATMPVIGWRGTYAAIGNIHRARGPSLRIPAASAPVVTDDRRGGRGDEDRQRRRRRVIAVADGAASGRRLLLLRGNGDAAGSYRRLLRRPRLWRGARRANAVAHAVSRHPLARRFGLPRRRDRRHRHSLDRLFHARRGAGPLPFLRRLDLA